MLSEVNKNELGMVFISEETIAKAAALAVSECYGVVGMSSQKKIKDGVFELLGKENVTKGVVLHKVEDSMQIEVNVILKYGVKLTEVARSIQQKVVHDLRSMGMQVDKVDVNVQDVRVDKDEK